MVCCRWVWQWYTVDGWLRVSAERSVRRWFHRRRLYAFPVVGRSPGRCRTSLGGLRQLPGRRRDDTQLPAEVCPATAWSSAGGLVPTSSRPRRCCPSTATQWPASDDLRRAVGQHRATPTSKPQAETTENGRRDRATASVRPNNHDIQEHLPQRSERRKRQPVGVIAIIIISPMTTFSLFHYRSSRLQMSLIC